MDKNLIIHIGYPKTGTTTIQKHIFTLDEIVNIHFDIKKIEKIAFQNEIAYKQSTDELTNYIEDKVKENKDKKTFVISSETFTSVSTFFRFKPEPFIWSPDPSAIARKLFYLQNSLSFNNIKIVITIRKQADFLKSNYAQMFNLVYRNFKQTKTFENFLNYSLIENFDNSIGSAINYNKVILEYEELFGKDNVCILVYEDLLTKPEKFAESLGKLLGIDKSLLLKKFMIKENVKKTDTHYKLQETNLVQYFANNPKFIGLKHFGNEKTQSFLKNLMKKIKFGKKRLKLDIPNESELMNLYKKDNKKLSERHNLDLDKYNYY